MKNTVQTFQQELEKLALKGDLSKNVEYQLRAVMHTSVDAIIMSDSSGTILSWNHGAKVIFGYEASEVLGEPLTILIPDKYKQAHINGMERVKKGHIHIVGQTAELEGVRKTGEVFPLELSISCWELEGELFFGGIIRDITERKRFENALQENEAHLKLRNHQLEAANQEIALKNTHLQTLSSKLSKYLPPQVYDSIFSGENDVRIATTRKKLTVCFSDIVGFTARVERMDEKELSHWLNTYLNDMADIALRYGGTLDKFIGDAVMVFFGDPQTSGERQDALKCVLMALEMRERARLMGIDIRIGINTGECTVGNFGSENRMDYTIVGRTVNLASRLESSSEPGQILIAESTFHLVKDCIQCKPRGQIHVKGIDREITPYWAVDYQRDCPTARSTTDDSLKS